MSTLFRYMKVPRIWAFALALMPTQYVIAAGAATTQTVELPPPVETSEQTEDELDEVIIEGRIRKPIRSPQKIFDWMARVVGQYTVEGIVDLHGKSRTQDMRTVKGQADCVGFGVAPAVQCELKIRWPETKGPLGEPVLAGVSTLDPAMLLFGYDDESTGIRYMLVDSVGVAEEALGYLITTDTLASRTPCAGVTGNCQRAVSITADPDLKMVEMKIDLEIDYARAARYTFVLRRVPGSLSLVVEGEKK